jgi:RNA polymerase sigma-70 factor (ECF subfamily)
LLWPVEPPLFALLKLKSFFSTSDDVTLLQAVARRDEAAFEELYDRMSRPLFSMVLRVVRGRAEAEEVLQEAFWQIWENAPSFQTTLGSPFCWMVTIARRKAIDRLRSSSRHLQRITEAQAQRVDDDYAPAIALDQIAAGERSATVNAALAALAPEERQAIVLAFFDGLTHPEIAAALSAPVGTIKSRIKRGLSKLESALGNLQSADSR